ncbi:MAG: citrate transporter [Oscillospiraceae bacterium]|nr:citrate transporter [Oscillospiraceae bacterium]
MKTMEKKSFPGMLQSLFQSQPVLVIAFAAAVITVCIVPPDREYMGYCNRTVLIQLFGLMLAVSGARSAGVFDLMTNMMMKKTGTLRKLGFLLMLFCFFTSMLVTNDVVLLTFVPLTIMLYQNIRDEKSRIMTIVLETAAANLGSMMTPVGNPQNLFLYDYYSMQVGTFLKVMLPSGFISLVLLSLLCFLLPNTPCQTVSGQKAQISVKPSIAYALLFVICLGCVFRIVPDLVLLPAAVLIALICNPSLLKKVDYALLATFVCFFVFVGNIARIEIVSRFVSEILSGYELLISALLSQVISNVPSAVMLSGFTSNGESLLLGVNLGGLGTMIASLASLISFQFYRKSANADTVRYMAVFSAVNFGMLAVLLTAALLL